MTSKHKILLSALSTALLINLFCGAHIYSNISESSGEAEGFPAFRRLTSVVRLIRQNYVDESKVGYTELIEGALRGMVGTLDRFSSYIPPKDFDRMREQTEGEFGGVGIHISVKDGQITILEPIDGSPAQRAGLIRGDRIIKVEDQITAQLPLDEAIAIIKGEPGTSLRLTVYRPATKATFEVTVERAVIEIETVKDAALLDNTIGYLRITQFNDKTARRFSESLEALREQGARALIIDLRDNPGGLLLSAVDVCSLFLPNREMVVFTEGRRKEQYQEQRAMPGPKFLDLPLAVLINGGSASASEIVAGCLQDHQRAILVGEKSFGKASVQTIVELEDGSAVRLTTAYYYTPKKRMIHGQGIAPDQAVEISDQLQAQLRAMRIPREIGEEAPEHVEDPQLDRALGILRSRLQSNDPDR